MIHKNVFFLLALSLFFTSCSRSVTDHGAFSFGVNNSIKSAPIIIASSVGLFEKEGLSIDIEIENSAVALMDGLFSKKYDLVGIPVYQAIVNSYLSADFRIIAVLNRNQSRSLVMNSRVVNDSTDLAGKRIGLVKNSAADFSLYRLLLFNGLTESDVIVQYFNDENLPVAIACGEVDAVISWEPFTSTAVSLLGKDALVENCHKGSDMYWLLVTRAELVEARTADLSALLRAIDKSNFELNTNTTRSLNTVGLALSISPELLKKEWDDYTFYLELPQSLLLSMEQEDLWYRNQTNQEPLVEDFLELIDGTPISSEFHRRNSVIGMGEFNVP